MKASGNSRRNRHAPMKRQQPPPGWPSGQPGGLFSYLWKTISGQGDIAPLDSAQATARRDENVIHVCAAPAEEDR